MKKIFIVLAALCYLTEISAQTDKTSSQHTVGFKTGFLFDRDMKGMHMDFQYAYSMTPHFDVVMALTSSSGTDTKDIVVGNPQFRINSHFYASSIEAGVRGAVGNDIWYASLTARVGACYSFVQSYNVETDFWGYIGPVNMTITGLAEYGIHITPHLDLAVFILGGSNYHRAKTGWNSFSIGLSAAFHLR